MVRASPSRTRILVACVILVLSSVAVPGTPSAFAAEGGGPEIKITDNKNDVAFLDPTLPPSPNQAGAIDIVGATFGHETGESLILTVDFLNLRDDLPTFGTDGLLFAVCFTWSGTQFAVKVDYRGHRVGDTPLGIVQGECASTLLTFTKTHGLGKNLHDDLDHNQFVFTIPRAWLGQLKGGDPPRAGDTIEKVRVLASDGGLFAAVAGSKPRTRFDFAPDAGPDGQKLILVAGTSNFFDLRARLDSTVKTDTPCQGQTGLPMYVIETGGKRGVPISFTNDGPERTIRLSARTLAGPNWNPKLIPSIVMPPSLTAGNTTVTMILDTPPSTTHKECSIFAVTGSDADAPDHLAEATFAVMALDPPTPLKNKLYFHDAQDATTVNSGSKWLNVNAKDPLDTQTPTFMTASQGGISTSSVIPGPTKDPVTMRTFLDVNPSNDLVINTTAVGKRAIADLNFNGETAPTTARITVTLVDALVPPTPIGSGSVETTINGATNVKVPVTISFGRDFVAEGDPSRTLPAQDGLGVEVKFEPLSANQQVPGLQASGRVSFLPKDSFIDLPIYATIPRNVNTPGAKGALLSIKPADVVPQFAAPGAGRLFNFTVLNEGAEPDTAVTTAAFTGAKDWIAEFIPPGPYALKAGERKAFTVVVTPPSTAKESESVVLDLTVQSQRDPTSKAVYSSKITATSEFSVPKEEAPNVHVATKKGGLPGPEPVALFGMVAVALTLLRRRRH